MMENSELYSGDIEKEDSLDAVIERQDDGNVIFRFEDESTETVSEFLIKRKPSIACRKLVPRRNNSYADQREIPNQDNAGPYTIWVHNEKGPRLQSGIYSSMCEEWRKYLSEIKIWDGDARKRAKSKTLDIADRYSYKSGKWILYVDDGNEVDEIWKLIVKGLAEGELGTVAMKTYVHAGKSVHEGTSYVITIRNEDYTDEHQMNTIVKFVRKTGFKRKMNYKLDAYVAMKILPKNPFFIQPSIYVNSGTSEHIVAYVDQETPLSNGERSEAANIPTQHIAQNIICMIEPNHGNFNVEKWLQQYSPSKYFTRDLNEYASVFGNIQIHNAKRVSGKETPQHENVMHAQQHWKKCISSGEDIDYQKICDIAKKYHVTCGKWILYADIEHVDIFWALVVKGIINKGLSQMEITAEVSSCNVRWEHIISVSHRDFTNNEEVEMLETLLRDVGVKCSMMYQPDIYNYLQIRSNNSFRLNPFTFESDYDAMMHQSTIRCLV